MSPADRYKSLAAELHARARNEGSPNLSSEWDHLADCYDRLAEQAERNERTDITYEPILRS
jgi:hypothetical protein